MSINPVQCPLCDEMLDGSEDLDTHLVEAHSKTELAEFVVEAWEEGQGPGPT
ncbi:hypothetical protein [Haloarchaeobius litoreus]|uniref:C2H2-type domain-containing protein n=1 Tax=Haloarchaeobius litoreus TaxID=755306 RepID=A0ABD6DKM0_9EURY|nr:hypothetical protein [Haloarchaeobius litoreus]